MVGIASALLGWLVFTGLILLFLKGGSQKVACDDARLLRIIAGTDYLPR